MSLKLKHALLAASFMLGAVNLSAQVEKLPESMRKAVAAELPDVIEKTDSPIMVKHLKSVLKDGTLTQKINAVRVGKDMIGNKSDIPFVYYSVPAMSEMQRLPDAYPLDGKAMAPVRIIAAQDEFEPGSFVVYPLEQTGKADFKLGEFKTADGKIFPQNALDLKVIKVWYQNGNGWYSYFGDTELKLTPELLLNDEDLIKVDTRKKQNYARLTEPADSKTNPGAVTYQWLTPKLEFNSRYEEHYRSVQPFASMKSNFDDAKTLQKIALNNGEFKQLFLTAHVTDAIQPGLYKGSVNVSANGKALGAIPVSIRVLPFKLPDPKAYFDLSKDYLTCSYSYISFDMIAEENGGDYSLVEKQLLAVLKNQAEHNQMMHWVRGSAFDYEYGRTIDIMKKAGMRTDYIVGGGISGENPLLMRVNAKLAKKWYADRGVGQKGVFLGYGDEPGATWLMNARPIFEAYQSEGFKFIIAGGDTVLYKAGYIYDFHNVAKNPEDRDATRKWNEIGKAHVAWYATHHVGPENPAFNRRQYGIAPYLANYSATCNYAHHFGPYNDRSTTYKPMVLAYGSHSGVIDTLAWEGFREGVDDIRYATLMKTLALEASKSKDIATAYAGAKALELLAVADPATVDTAALRLEMVSRILELKKLLGK